MYAQAHMHVTKPRILGVPTNFGCTTQQSNPKLSKYYDDEFSSILTIFRITEFVGTPCSTMYL